MTTIFSQIIERKIPADVVYESEQFIAFHDINPTAPVHILIVPKKATVSLQTIQKEDLPLMGEAILIAQELAETFNIAEGYRFLTNVGPDAGQSVFHLHFHLIGGAKLGPLA
jgi:histidine triad (HIT) family protein